MLTQELLEVLHAAGADLAGAAEMQTVESCPYPRAVAIGLALPVSVLRQLEQGPTMAYSRAKRELDARLDELALLAEQFLLSRGFAALAQTTKRIQKDETWRTPVPHKTVATRAGLGWIGKNCLLVTETFGSGLRLTSVLTDAPLCCQSPVEQSRCQDCTVCQSRCPAGALRGALWQVRMEREVLLDRQRCKNWMLEQQPIRGLDQDLCGRCFAVCPYTRRYVERAAGNQEAKP